ncbi:MAG TPA: hypothetical protein VML55_13195 [Planctomycetaceae bacterium]|nr:hypothetical protein [Planctomycetaceae bacterium]
MTDLVKSIAERFQTGVSGVDHNFSVNSSGPAVELLLRVVRQHWPDAVVRNADSEHSTPVSGGVAVSAEALGDEFFVYRDSRTKTDVDRHGLAARNAAGLFRVMLGHAADGSGPICVIETYRDAQVLDDLLADFGAVLTDKQTLKSS